MGIEYPRILVVTSNNFNLVTGGGITLTNLFHGWPADRIANLHEDPQPSDDTVCHRFYRLTGKEIRLAWPFSLMVPDTNGTGALASGNETQTSALKISRALFGDGVPRRFVVTDSLARWLDNFRPEVIYSFLGSMAQIRVTAELTRRYQARLAIHIMDDWPAVIYRSGLVGPFLRRSMMSEFHELLRQSIVRLAICEDMCDDYRKRFGVDFLPFHNAIDTNEWFSHARRSWQAGSPFVVRYAGSIVKEAQRDSLRDICLAVANLRRSGHSIEMWVHAPANQHAHLQESAIEGLHLADSPDPASIMDLLAGADLLILPFNFDQHSSNYMRLSMPTKIPAYMASGTPILIYGPETIAPVRYATRAGWACVASKAGIDKVEDVLRQIITDASLREQYGRRAQLVARERHDAARVRYEFQTALA